MAGNLIDADRRLDGLENWLGLLLGGSLGQEWRLTACLKPTQLPVKLRGTLMTNHIPKITSIVVNGTAPLEPLAHRKRFRRKNVANTIPGIKIGVRAIFCFHFSPPNDL